MQKEYKVLMVEDITSDATLIERQLKMCDIHFQSLIVDNSDDYAQALQAFKPDIILSDFNLPAFDGFSALMLRQELAPLTPFILVTGTTNEETAVKCMKAGADDYILKENLTRLGQAFRSAIENKAIASSNKEALKKLRILSRAVEQNPALIIITDKTGKIEYVNPRFTEATGYTLSEVIGKTPGILKSGKQSKEFYSNLWQTILSGKEWSGEFSNKKKNGDLYWENARISPLLDIDGEITHFVAIKEDVTEKRQMIQDLIIAKEKAEAGDKLKSAFINNISHEVRTPLSGIVGFSEMITNGEISHETRLSYNDIIRKSSMRLLNTITGYLDISLLVSGNMEVHPTSFPVYNLFLELQAEFGDACKEKNIELVVIRPEVNADVQLNTDRELLQKIWFHLLDNAVKYTSEGKISFGCRKSGKSVEFFVTDTGVGIDSDKTRIIFDFFMQADASDTRKFEGSGLGLSIANELVKLLGGKISMQSTKNAGSTFSFNLPGIDVPVILVAEDDDLNFKYLDIILHKSGYQVLRAANGQEAVGICKNNNDVDMVLMDMKMPVMGGLEATALIKVFLPELPVIAVTAYVSTNDENEAYLAGCCEFLSKPVNKTKLLAIIQNYLRN
jgi:PAS domain S-box-containing protein